MILLSKGIKLCQNNRKMIEFIVSMLLNKEKVDNNIKGQCQDKVNRQII